MRQKQHANKKTNGSVLKSRGNYQLKNTLRQMTMKRQPYKIYGMQQKQLLEGSS